MPLSIKKLKQRAREYVEMEADTKVLSVKFIESFTLFGREDVVLSVKTTDFEDPEWWVVAGSSPMNLYSKRAIKSDDEAFSMHTGLMLRMIALQNPKGPESVGYDAFISHASEDKDELVRPLAEKLAEMGFNIWYDEFELRVGDSLRQKIDKGLSVSSYGIVVLSEAFFAKNWPQYELNGLVAREIDGEKVILPVWHNVTKSDVLKYSPSLADKIALSSSGKTIEDIANGLAEVLKE
ncbi:MAG: TIR domain-containing protein [Bacteroidales bacterium]|nr:TIR domain-containing protein [Bacteroidales bacterium]